MTREQAEKEIVDTFTEVWADEIIKALKQEAEPVYFPPCVDCQERSKKILIAYDNMINMQTFTKEEVITMFEEIKAEIEEKATDLCDDGWWLTYNNLIQQKIERLKG